MKFYGKGEEVNTLFCDNHLLVIVKPAGLPTQAEPGEPSLHAQAKEWVKQKFKKPGNVYLEPIHRLDKPVEGIVIFARTSKALERLQAAVRERKMHKTYHAWVEGALLEKEGELTHYLVHGDHRAEVVAKTHPQAKQAVLRYRVLQEKENKTLLEIQLLTGRYHQIRAQLSAIGHPIVGDRKYGSFAAFAKDEIALYHTAVEIEHPVQKTPLRWTTPCPTFSFSKG